MTGRDCRRSIPMLVSLLAACGGAEASRSWTGRVDTTQSGTIVVTNPATGAWDSATAWRLEEELRVGSDDGTGPASFNNIRALEVDPQGRIYVLENDPQEIRVFNADGRYVRTIGHPGKGPGEFTEAIGMAWDSLGRLWVVDQRNVRYTVFDTSGTRITDYPRPVSSFFTWQWQGGIGRDGRVYEVTAVPGADFRLVLVRLDEHLRLADTIPLPQYEMPMYTLVRGRSRTSYGVPFAPSLHWVLDPRGYVWFGVSDRYRVYQQRLDGDTVRITERAYEPVPVTGAEKDSEMVRLKSFTDQGGRADRSRIPDTKPVFEGLVVDDDGYLWVRATGQRGVPGTGFDVFDPEGRYLGTVRSPEVSFLSPLIRGNTLYAVLSGREGIDAVARFRIIGRQRASSAGKTSIAPTVPARVPPAVASAIAPNN